MSKLKCGAAERVITPSLEHEYNIPGYYHERIAEGVITDIKTNVIVLDDGEKTFYVSGDTLYRIGMSDTRFTGYELPLDQPVTRLMGVLTNGKAIVSCGNDVYVITLPTGVDKK